MDIIVTIKQVPDPNLSPANIQLDAVGKRIISPPGIPPVMNGYDANALEAALRLREQHGGSVTAVGLGDDSSRPSLKQAIAMGADTAILLGDEDWLHEDSRGVARVLAAAIRKIGRFDLILCGRQASDTDGGQVLHWIGEFLDVPTVSPVSKIEEAGEHSLTVDRLIQDGYQRLRVDLPALLGISSEINEPRYPPPRGVMKAERTRIPAWKGPDLEVGKDPALVELRQLQIQLRTSNVELIQGGSGAEQGEALAGKLHELGLI